VGQHVSATIPKQILQIAERKRIIKKSLKLYCFQRLFDCSIFIASNDNK
jgi:hypothetical protein